MIEELKLSDSYKYYELGNMLNKKFKQLYPLDRIIDNDNEYIYGYYLDNLLVAFIHITKSFDVIDINNIIVDQKYRNNNIGSKLINYIVNKHNGTKELLLEVRSKNTIAINFYKKNNFKCIHIRKNYYENDDAYIMKRDVI